MKLKVEENIAVPMKLLTLNVSQDFKSRARSGYTFSIVPGVDSEWFHIERFNGTLFLIGNPDREKVTRLETTVQVHPLKKARGFPHMIFPGPNSDLGNKLNLYYKIFTKLFIVRTIKKIPVRICIAI